MASRTFRLIHYNIRKLLEGELKITAPAWHSRTANDKNLLLSVKKIEKINVVFRGKLNPNK